MENKYYEASQGDITASLYAVESEGQMLGISFPCVTKEGIGINMAISLTQYGLENDYNGEHKSNVDSALKKLENKIKKAYSLSFEEKPVVEIPEIRDMENEQTV